MDKTKNDSEKLLSLNNENDSVSKSETNDNSDNLGTTSPLHTEIDNPLVDHKNLNTGAIDSKHSSVPVVVVSGEKGEDRDYHLPYSPFPTIDRPRFPSPGFGFDNELGSIQGSTEIPDVNIYQHKKTLAQGMMDLALFSANANQLRYVLESFARHPFYYPSVILISLSLFLQIGIGVGLIWNATYNVKDEKEICIANKINNFTIIGIFLVTVINVFISAFGVADPA